MIRLLPMSLLAAGLVSAAQAQAVKEPWPDFLSPEAKAGLAADAARPPEPADIAGRRARIEAIQQEIGVPRLARYGVTMKEDMIAGVRVRIFTPAKGAAKAPVLLNLHGGGFVLDAGSISENAAVAARTGYRVVAVRYRLAPEHAFPEGVEDALAVYRALLADHDPARIGVYGTSAGAILSAELVARLRAETLPQPAALGFFSGAGDLSRAGDSAGLFADAAVVDAQVRLYAGRTTASDPLFSPQLGDLTHWPATLCLASTRDFLLSGTADFCRAIDAAGAPAKLVVFDGLPHAFWAYIDSPESDEAFAVMARFFTERLGERP